MLRRTDNDLRQAINVVEKMLLTDPTKETIILRCLGQLMDLLGATFGYAYECGDAADDGSVEWMFAGSYIQQSGEAISYPNTCSSNQIPAQLQARFSAGRCIDSSTGELLAPLPHRHPKVNNFYCVPLTDARRIYAVIYLCNSPQGFPAITEKRLRPFIATSSCLLRSADKTYSFQKRAQHAESISEHPEVLLGLIDSMFNSVIVVNEEDEITVCNSAAAAMLGLPRRNIIGLPISAFLPKGAPNLENRMYASAGQKNNKDGQKSLTTEVSSPRKAVWRGVPVIKGDGKKTLVDLSAFEIESNGKPLRGLVMDDISERMQSASDYHATLQRFQVLTNLAPVGILQLDRNWKCTYANDTWCEYCQMTPDEAGDTGWLKGLYSADVHKVLDGLRDETARTGKFEGEFRLQSPLGRVTWVKANACSLYAENGQTSGLIITFNDITERLSNERRLQDIAEKDQLTGLVNRAFFNDRVEIALKGLDRFGAVVLMFIDLDEFKPINDTFGHAAGDYLLCEVANRMRDSLRQVDTIARIGGDEFTVLLTNVQNTRSITAIADKLISTLIKPFMINGRPIYVTASIGIAVATAASDSESDNGVSGSIRATRCSTNHKNSVEHNKPKQARINEDDPQECSVKQLLKQADSALYKAKAAGRNQYKFYTHELDKDADLHILLRQSLKEQSRNDFRVVYQPQVNAKTGKVIGLEALTRWQHVDAEAIGPDVFIKMIEQSGLVNEFSEWLLLDVLKTMKQWQEERPNLLQGIKVSINLSAKQFRNKELATYIHNFCILYQISPKKIILEITESALIEDPEVTCIILLELRNMGFEISLDDFGTGYSSLAYLRSMPLHSVKIDRSFIEDVIHHAEGEKIVSAVLGLAATLGLGVIAEGVDNDEVKNWLVEHNCPDQQGFYFYKPLEKHDATSLLVACQQEARSNVSSNKKNASKVIDTA